MTCCCCCHRGRAQPDNPAGLDEPYAKGSPLRMFDAPQAANVLSDIALDCTRFNAISVQVYSYGSPSVTVEIDGAVARGGNYLPLIDPNAEQAITADKIFDVICGPAWGKVRLKNYVSGSFMVVCTPYVSPGPTALVATV